MILAQCFFFFKFGITVEYCTVALNISWGTWYATCTLHIWNHFVRILSGISEVPASPQHILWYFKVDIFVSTIDLNICADANSLRDREFPLQWEKKNMWNALLSEWHGKDSFYLVSCQVIDNCNYTVFSKRNRIVLGFEDLILGRTVLFLLPLWGNRPLDLDF